MSLIRSKAVCLFRRDDKILLAEGYDPTKDRHYVIPVGGGIDFGEKSIDAARREVLEEIGETIHGLALLGVSENRFTFDGVEGHEIVFVYEAQFDDESLYEKQEIRGIESDGQNFVVKWFDVNVLLGGTLPFYPDGVVDMLK